MNPTEQYKQYKAVIFDWDGTLMNSEARIVDAIQTAVNSKADASSPTLTGTGTAVNLTVSGTLNAATSEFETITVDNDSSALGASASINLVGNTQGMCIIKFNNNKNLIPLVLHFY